MLKENIHKISIASKVEENEVDEDNAIEQSTLPVDKDFVEAVLNFNKNNEVMQLSMY